MGHHTTIEGDRAKIFKKHDVHSVRLDPHIRDSKPSGWAYRGPVMFEGTEATRKRR